MPNLSHAVVANSPRFRGYLPSNGWTLCVGAGVSKGIAPDWNELAYQVVSHTFAHGITKDEFNELVKETAWSLDSWIQAAANVHRSQGKTDELFKELIESILYSVIRDKAKGLGIEKHLTRVLNFPRNEPKDRVIEVCDLIETSFPNSSLIQLANTLIRCSTSGHRPKAILTFNADTFLETLINLFIRRNHYLGPGPHSHPVYPFVQIIRPSHRSGTKIPIIHCHGCIAPRWSTTVRPRDARDRLVFLEQEYLAMAAGRAAWAETTFLYHAQSTKLVFLGMSMSDPNIRRWMNAIILECEKDWATFNYNTRQNPDHIWLRPFPSNHALESLLLPSLYHLGVRPAWIPSWSHLGQGLENLAAIS